LDSILLSYSQVFFCHDRWVGLIIFCATALRFDFFIAGLLAVLLANFFAFSLHLDHEMVKQGMFGYNALLLGLSFPYFFKIDIPLLAVFVLVVLSTALVTAALKSVLGYYFNLPVLTLPFLIGIYPVLAASSTIQGINLHPLGTTPSPLTFYGLGMVEAYLKSLGAVFFMPEIISGLLLFIALLFFSRIAVLLSFLGFAVGAALIRWVFHFPMEHLYLSIGFNFILTAIAIGGIWFVPQKSSFLFAGGGVFLCSIILVGSAKLFSIFGLPVLILPFNLTLLLLLYGMRQRTVDRHPKLIDFISGTPETNLIYYRTRLARFGSHFNLQISLPFLGTWTCTQGQGGSLTHQGLWEQSYDFEVRGPSGELYKNDGREVSNYLCHRLPVLACADGRVVKVVDQIPDNPVGEPDLEQNWGNLILIQHGPFLFSIVCHLARGSSKVREGNFIRRGEIIGLCGNSGRSSTPHLHFHLQRTERVGSPTVYSEFHEVILEGEAPILHCTYVPRKGDRVRNIRKQQEIADYFNFPVGRKILLTCRIGNRIWEEEVESVIDLYGNLKLQSPAKKATLIFENRNSTFVIYDFQGPPDSALFILYASAPRVPYESAEALTYYDTLPLRHFQPRGKQVLSDLIAPFFNGKELRLNYRCHHEKGGLIISGSSSGPALKKDLKIEAKAIFHEGAGWMGGYLLRNGRKEEVIRKREEDILNEGGAL